MSKILEHAKTIESGLRTTVLECSGKYKNTEETPIVSLETLDTTLDYILTTKHKRKFLSLTSSYDESMVCIPGKGNCRIYLDLVTKGLTIRWSNKGIKIVIPSFKSNKGILTVDAIKGRKTCVTILNSFMNTYVYNYLWSICSQGLTRVYTPDMLNTGEYNYSKLANLLYLGLYGFKGDREVQYQNADGFKITLSTLIHIESNDRQIVTRPYLYIQSIEKREQGGWSDVKGWSQNVVLLYDVMTEMKSVVNKLLKKHEIYISQIPFEKTYCEFELHA